MSTDSANISTASMNVATSDMVTIHLLCTRMSPEKNPLLEFDVTGRRRMNFQCYFFLLVWLLDCLL